jgi:hypothetical protein
VSVAVAGYVERGDTVTLTASRGSAVLPADSVQWSATPATVARVLSSQRLALLDTGAATITATVGDTTVTDVIHVATPPLILFDMIDVNGSLTRTVFQIALDGGNLARVASDSSENFKATSAGGVAVYTSYRTGDPSLYETPLAGGAETSLDSLPYPTSEAALSADGTRLAFVTSVTGNNKVWTSNAKGTGAIAVTANLGPAGVDEENPTWSPADTALVFVTTQYGDAALVQLSLKASTETQLTPGTTTSVDPAWSPDGTTLAFASTRDGDVGIFLLTLSNGAVTRLTPQPGNDGEPAWLPDGRVVYTSFANPSASVLRWVDPAHPTVVHQIPTPAGASPERPAAVR